MRSRSVSCLVALSFGAFLAGTGAASARESLAKDLADHYPVDLTVEQTDGATGLTDGDVATVSDVAGVDEVVPVPVALAQVGDSVFRLAAPDPDQAARVLRSAGALDDLTDGTVLLPKQSGDAHGTVAVQAMDPDTGELASGRPSLDLETVATDLGGQEALVTPATLERLAPDAPTSVVWVRLDDSADPTRVLQDIRDALPDSPVNVVSAAAQRQGYERLISSLLAVVVGLLAVAVVIALVGVANTLSLSVIERRRESATLRAIGLTRRQLRWMLAVEGMLIAVVGAVLGALLGLLYGWAGAATAFGQTGDLRLAVPWRDLGLVLVVALLAGLVASVLPARAAARTSPVAALAVD